MRTLLLKVLVISHTLLPMASLAAEPVDTLKALYKKPTEVPFPKENPPSPARISLGKMLFFDPRLSGSDWISCATCHNPTLEWGDGLRKALGDGMKQLPRRTPTLLNLAWSELLFWDGRADSLEAQALMPLSSTAEMNMPQETLVRKLRDVAGYPALFESAYPGEGISSETVAKALATYERTLNSGDAPFDRWIQGDSRAMSAAAVKGFFLFNGKALCSRCHSGWRFTDDSFHDIGVADDDNGRGHILPDIEVLQHAFKTPTLRNVARRAPYLHNGSEPTLESVVDFYNRGGKIKRSSQTEDVRPLNLNREEQAALVAFMKALTSHDKAVELPVLPR